MSAQTGTKHGIEEGREMRRRRQNKTGDAKGMGGGVQPLYLALQLQTSIVIETPAGIARPLAMVQIRLNRSDRLVLSPLATFSILTIETLRTPRSKPL